MEWQGWGMHPCLTPKLPLGFLQSWSPSSPFPLCPVQPQCWGTRDISGQSRVGLGPLAGTLACPRALRLLVGLPRCPGSGGVVGLEGMVGLLPQVTCHELCHLLGLGHCRWLRCVMQGALSLDEVLRRPLDLCPVCLRKLQHVLGFKLVDRYKVSCVLGGRPQAPGGPRPQRESRSLRPRWSACHTQRRGCYHSAALGWGAEGQANSSGTVQRERLQGSDQVLDTPGAVSTYSAKGPSPHPGSWRGGPNKAFTLGGGRGKAAGQNQTKQGSGRAAPSVLRRPAGDAALCCQHEALPGVVPRLAGPGNGPVGCPAGKKPYPLGRFVCKLRHFAEFQVRKQVVVIFPLNSHLDENINLKKVFIRIKA